MKVPVKKKQQGDYTATSKWARQRFAKAIQMLIRMSIDLLPGAPPDAPWFKLDCFNMEYLQEHYGFRLWMVAWWDETLLVMPMLWPEERVKSSFQELMVNLVVRLILSMVLILMTSTLPALPVSSLIRRSGLDWGAHCLERKGVQPLPICLQ